MYPTRKLLPRLLVVFAFFFSGNAFLPTAVLRRAFSSSAFLLRSDLFFIRREQHSSCTVLPTTTLRRMTTDTSSSSALPLVSPVQTENRTVLVHSLPTFLAVAAVLPVWAATVLPLTIVYQVARIAISSLVPSLKPTSASLPTLDSGYDASASTIVPRSQRKYDIVILGATGFAGKLAARYLAKTYGTSKTSAVKWAIAGRDKAKLEAVKQDLAKELKMDDIVKNVDVIVVDTCIPLTLPDLVSQTRVVASTAGPFVLYGNHVVEFCSKFGTHYVDITGEVDWVKTMVATWNTTAKETGAKIISFCGHDSIPWELSVFKFQEILESECNDELQSVSFLDEVYGAASGGTVATILATIEGVQPAAVSYDPFLRNRHDSGTSESRHVLKSNLPWMISKAKSPWDKNDNSKTATKRWDAPFVMALINAQVVGWSRALRSKGAVETLEYREASVHPDFKTAFVNHFGLIMFGSLLFNPLTRSLLKSHVLPKPGQGPALEEMDKVHYLSILGEGVGVKGNRVESIMYFSKDAGYLETARMLVEAGLCLALQEDQLPSGGAGAGGGFWTPSTALGNVLMKRLLDTGTTYSYRVVKK